MKCILKCIPATEKRGKLTFQNYPLQKPALQLISLGGSGAYKKF